MDLPGPLASPGRGLDSGTANERRLEQAVPFLRPGMETRVGGSRGGRWLFEDGTCVLRRHRGRLTRGGRGSGVWAITTCVLGRAIALIALGRHRQARPNAIVIPSRARHIVSPRVPSRRNGAISASATDAHLAPPGSHRQTPELRISPDQLLVCASSYPALILSANSGRT